MKYFIYTLFFCLFASITSAQNHLKEVQFINEFIAQKNADEIESLNKLFGAKKITHKVIIRNDYFYEDSVGVYAIGNMKKDFLTRRNVFYGSRQDSMIYVDSVGKRTVLSKNDADDLAHANIRSKKIIQFRLEEMVGDSLIITEKERLYINAEIDKMRQYIWGKNEFLNMKFIASDTVKKIFADVKHSGWEEMKKRGVGRIYNFSKPIFIRSNSYCVFYYGYSCGWLCGEGQFAIYKKQKNKWVLFTMLYSWVS